MTQCNRKRKRLDDEIVVIVEEKRFLCKAELLRTESEFFSGLLKSCMNEMKTKTVELKDITKQEFCAVMNIISCPNNDDIKIEEGRAVYILLDIGDKYGIKKLMDVCDDHLLKKHKPDLKLFELSARYGLRRTEEKCRNWFTDLLPFKITKKQIEKWRGNPILLFSLLSASIDRLKFTQERFSSSLTKIINSYQITESPTATLQDG